MVAIGSSARALRVLILGGSSEASALARALAGRPMIDPILSLAGRTAAPAAISISTRVGGFGGVAGLIGYLHHASIDVLVDATHPFAAQMSRHARLATQQTGVPLIRLTRDPWHAEPGDRWREVADMAGVIETLGPASRRVFLTVGRLQLDAFKAAPWHFYLVRTIEPVEPGYGLAHADFIEARGPFTVEAEIRLMRDYRIDVLATKNSGGDASAAKLEAARHLGIPVILVSRPLGSSVSISSVAEAIAAIEAHAAPPTPRGV